MLRKRNLALLGAALATLTTLLACSDDDADDGMGMSSGSATTSSGGASSSSGNATTSSGGASSSGSSSTDSGTSLTLYQRLGEAPGLASFVDTLVAAELMDAEIASYFFFQSSGASGGPAAGHSSVAQIKGCLVAQLGNAVGGPQAYPAVVDGFQCRDMIATHATLGIPGGVFDKFIVIAAGLLSPAIKPMPSAVGEISQNEFDTIAGFLVGTKPDVAQDTTRDGGSFIQPDSGI